MYIGIGKTTLANEICNKWASGMLLHEDFTIVIMIALRTLQKRSLEDVMIEQIGSEAHQELTKTLGGKCLIILEGLDEMAAEQRHSDPLLVKLLNFIVFVKAVLLITSRPHAGQELNANRKIEIVGFGQKQIKSFVELSFPSDGKIADTFIQQIMEYPHIYSLCYVPVSLVMIIDIFKYRQQSLPSTLTELYQHFTVMMLVRERNKSILVSSTALATVNVEQIYKALPGVPKNMIGKLFLLSKLAYHGFIERNPVGDNSKLDGWSKVGNPRIIFSEDDLTQCNITITDNYDGEGLLKIATLHQLTGDCVTYNFVHLTVQEFLCAVYMLTLSQEEQYHLLNEYFDDYPNIMILYCGLTKLDFYKVVYSKLTSSHSTVTAVKCLYEGQLNTPPKSLSPFELDMSNITLLPYDCHCLSYVCYHYSVTQLDLHLCHIGDKNAEILAKWSFHKKNTKLQTLKLWNNNLTSEGIKHVMKIVTSELHYQLLLVILL